jgi:hypothetical protein
MRICIDWGKEIFVRKRSFSRTKGEHTVKVTPLKDTEVPLLKNPARI